MSYTYGTDNIKKNNYEIYVRAHKTAETIDKDNKLKAMLQDITAFATDITTDGTDQGDELITANRIYNIVGTNSFAGVISLANSVAGSEGDVILIKVSETLLDAGDALTNNVVITDEDALGTTLNGQYEVAIFYKGAVNWSFYGWANSDGVQSTEYVRIGACEEKPSIKTSQGASIMINNGDEITTSENLEITFNDLQINIDNYSYLKAFGNVDLVFYNDNNLPGTIIINNVEMTAFLEASGNDLNKTTVNIKLETDDVDNHMTVYKVV